MTTKALNKNELTRCAAFPNGEVFGVVSTRENLNSPATYMIVTMDFDSEDHRRFNWGSSCSGWSPLEVFADEHSARVWAEEWVRQEDANYARVWAEE